MNSDTHIIHLTKLFLKINILCTIMRVMDHVHITEQNFESGKGNLKYFFMLELKQSSRCTIFCASTARLIVL